MTNCDFSAKSARDEMKHIIRSSESDVIIRYDKDQNRGCRRMDKDHMELLCLSCTTHKRCTVVTFVHEQISEVISRMRCVMRIMASQ